MPTLATWLADAYAEITVSQQPASSDDTAAIYATVQGLVSDLAARRIYTVADLNNPADEPYQELVTLLAERAAPRFGRATDAEKVKACEQRLRAIDRLDRGASVPPLVARVLELLEAWGQARDAMDATAVEDHAAGIIEELAVRGVVTVNSVSDVDAEVIPNLSRYIAAALSAPPLYPVMDRAARELRTQTRTAADAGPPRALYF